MKNILSVLCFLFILSTFSIHLIAQNDEDAMKAWQEYMTPGEMHKWMASSEGDWEFKGKFWMAPGTEPTESNGTMKSEMILGGRYLKQTHYGSMMGMPFEGISTIAYDNSKKTFYNTWIDNMGTGVMTAEGNYSEADKSLNLMGSYFDPVTNTEKKFREVIKIVDENQQVFEMYMIEDAGEFKNMEIEFTRVK